MMINPNKYQIKRPSPFAIIVGQPWLHFQQPSKFCFIVSFKFIALICEFVEKCEKFPHTNVSKPISRKSL